MLWDLLRRILLRAIVISFFTLFVGAFLIGWSEYLVSHRVLGCNDHTIASKPTIFDCILTPISLKEMLLREFGIVLCSIGLISLLYEVVIRSQLIEDYSEKLTELINPDTRKFGVISLFEDRTDKTKRHRSLAEVLGSAKQKIMCFGLNNHSILADRDLILRKMRDGCSFQFLIFDPDSATDEGRIALELLDKSLAQSSGSLKKVIEAREDDYREVIEYFRSKGLVEDRFEVRTYNVIPTFGAIQIDDSRLIIELFGYKKNGLVCPGMELVKKGSRWQGQEIEEFDSRWYDFYDQQIATLWQHGKKL
jgi:hypothetical protein